jgi:hypothetical protein
MTGESMDVALSSKVFQYIWSIAVVMSPAFIIGGVAVAYGELVDSKETSAKQPKRQPKNEIAQPKTKPNSETVQPVSSLGGTRKLVSETYKKFPNATQAEVSQILEKEHNISISRQAVGKHKRALNGVLS